MSQTSINKAGQPVAVAGQLSDNGEGVDAVSRFSQETSLVIPFGCGVKPGSSSHGVIGLTASTDVVEGVSVWGFNHSPGATGDLDQSSGGLKPKAGLQVLRKGRVWVLVDPGVTSIAPYTDRGWCRFETDGSANPTPGAWGKTSDSHNLDCTKQAVFVSGLFTAADGTSKIAELEVDFTNKP